MNVPPLWNGRARVVTACGVRKLFAASNESPVVVCSVPRAPTPVTVSALRPWRTILPGSPTDKSRAAQYQRSAVRSRHTLPRRPAPVIHGERLHDAGRRISAPAAADRDHAARAKASARDACVLLDFRSGRARPARDAILGLDDFDVCCRRQVPDRPEQQHSSNDRESDDQDGAASAHAWYQASLRAT